MTTKKVKRPTRAEAEDAVRTLIRWAGDDPKREGLIETPKRVVKSFEDFFQGYEQDPEAILGKTFKDTGGYDEMVVLRNIRFDSHCEHHMVTFSGVAHVAYIPKGRVVGLSKLARLVEIYAKRLQIQEKMTTEIATTLDKVLKPHGVGVVLEATHLCMTTRGIKKPGAVMQTSHLLGSFRNDAKTRQEFFSLLKSDSHW